MPRLLPARFSLDQLQPLFTVVPQFEISGYERDFEGLAAAVAAAHRRTPIHRTRLGYRNPSGTPICLAQSMENSRATTYPLAGARLQEHT
jgi:hypothetical protein